MVRISLVSQYVSHWSIVLNRFLAGYYVPYIANYLYTHPGLVPLNLTGIWITDPSISHGLVQQYMVAFSMVQKFPNVFALNSTFMANLQNRSDACGYTGYSAKYATYPPNGPLPLPTQAFTNGIPDYPFITPQCALFDDIISAESLVNPNFNVYRILDVWPVLWVRFVTVISRGSFSPYSRSFRRMYLVSQDRS